MVSGRDHVLFSSLSILTRWNYRCRTCLSLFCTLFYHYFRNFQISENFRFQKFSEISSTPFVFAGRICFATFVDLDY